jgi:hypothetical protein
LTEANISGRGEDIEDIILSWDRRNMQLLRTYAQRNYCRDAAAFLQSHSEVALIVTGFFEVVPQMIETDGPPGALCIGRALEALGKKVIYASDRHATPFLEALAPDSEVLDFPITGAAESQVIADDILARVKPTVVVAVERCGVTASGRYLNSSGGDISEYTAMMDFLFPSHQASIGIGDGGNEIGMAAMAEHIQRFPGFTGEPVITSTTRLVIASVSNWGAYGMVAGLSILEGRDLLPSEEEAAATIERMAKMGAVDGDHLKPMAGVDGFTLQEDLDVLNRLRGVIRAGGVSRR